MFWRKKQPLVENPVEVNAPAKITEVASKPKANKLTGPRDVPELVGRHLVVALGQNPDWVWHLKSVVQPRLESKYAFYFRVFDEVQTSAKKVSVKNYDSLNAFPDLILFEGWFDKKSCEVHTEEQMKA